MKQAVDIELSLPVFASSLTPVSRGGPTGRERRDLLSAVNPLTGEMPARFGQTRRPSDQLEDQVDVFLKVWRLRMVAKANWFDLRQTFRQ